MPLPGDNFATATVLVPGAVLPTYNALGSTQGTERVTSFAASTQPSFNGNRMQTNNYILDGTDINEPLQNTIAYNIAPEAIGEMRIITGNADAEYGNVNGGEILDRDQVRNQPVPRQPLRVLREPVWQANTFANKATTDAAKRRLPPEPVRRYRRRPRVQEQTVLLRGLSGLPQTTATNPGHLGAFAQDAHG